MKSSEIQLKFNLNYLAVTPIELSCINQFYPDVILGSCGILEFALIYDEINQLLLVNILRAKVKYFNSKNYFAMF